MIDLGPRQIWRKGFGPVTEQAPGGTPGAMRDGVAGATVARGRTDDGTTGGRRRRGGQRTWRQEGQAADRSAEGQMLTDYEAQPERDCAKDGNKFLDGRRQVYKFIRGDQARGT